jgi:dTDP-4-dehydrorhamnose 3,5-epimerase
MNSSEKLTIEKTPLNDLLILKPKIFGDERGWFFESFNANEFAALTGQRENFVQDNHSMSKMGILRGLHYQTKHVQAKLVRVVNGVVFDVAVDLRKESSSFGKWFGIHLSAENKLQLWIPKGFAHGFLVLSEYAEFLYKTTDYYDPQSEVSLRWNDPTIGIQWPLEAIQNNPILSSKDSAGLFWDQIPKF